MLKEKYKEQNLIKLVRMKTSVSIIRKNAAVPEIIFVKYNLDIIIVTSIVTTMSIASMFIFICLIFDVSNLTPQKSTNEISYTATFVTQGKFCFFPILPSPHLPFVSEVGKQLHELFPAHLLIVRG